MMPIENGRWRCRGNLVEEERKKLEQQKAQKKGSYEVRKKGVSDGYYVAYKPITLSYILFMFIEINFIHCHSCVMFVMKFMSMCND